MKIKKIHILGYRRLKDIELSMDDNITFIAGANNCGKTSLVELFDILFGKKNMSYDDFSIRERTDWHNHIFSSIWDELDITDNKEENLTEKEKHQIKQENLTIIGKHIFPKTDTKNSIPPSICVKIQVDYEDSDDIRNFSDYLMDLDSNKRSFFFIYECSIDETLFNKNLEKQYTKLLSKFTYYKNKNDGKNALNKFLSWIFSISLKEKTYYSDGSYNKNLNNDNQNPNSPDFQRLFNYCNIFANRILDDSNTDKNKTLSKNMIAIASEDNKWDQKTPKLADKIFESLQETKIEDIIQETSLNLLKEAINTISETNGGHTGELSLETDISENAIRGFIKNIIHAQYKLNDCQLDESSQGLGYSNLIYIILQIEKYKKSIDPLKVNFFMIEEPEAHMHPQMQNVFTDYLRMYCGTQKIQYIITTHSTEVVRGATEISKLRVLRQKDKFSCNFFDLKKFCTSLSSQIDEKDAKNLIAFYNFFFTINFPDMIFADKILMYEGDTERMFINRLLLLEKFKSLRQQYISFVQVGGAYAHSYKNLIEFLKIKTAIITDIDYEKCANDLDTIKKSKTTNATINFFAKQHLEKKELTISELYDWQKKSAEQNQKRIIIDDLTYLAFQGEKDHYSRTLEETILAKLYEQTHKSTINVYDMKNKDEWKKIKEKNKFKFSIPQKKQLSIRDIVNSQSFKKTDFMYSVLLNSQLEPKHKDSIENMLPNYIEEALEWLAK
ncbi:AAA family ATPase [Bartonella sp. A05]|uniref:AAA family ATPase n=1 Tax=Bartonella sp. A05 TaxID=2967261 RepID=UPI0022A90273|nr:AAA family ATPase [Bartonella sp. A05]MCZ2203935.1 ATP-dependent endonuclease [Bartonella sp. A05]